MSFKINYKLIIYFLLTYVHKIKVLNYIYLVWQISSKADNKFSSLMVFGHNNGLSELAHYLCERFSETIPTAGIVCMQLNVKGWAIQIHSLMA